METIENIFDALMPFILNPSQEGWLFLLKVVFIVISFLFFASIIFLLVKTSWFKFFFVTDIVEILTHKPAGIKKMEKDWKKIILKLESGLESEYKLAIIEADNMANEVLKRMGYNGETLGERLEKLTAAILPNIEEVKEVRKIRHNIIHDPNYKLSLEEAKKTLEVYDKMFRELNVF